MLHIMRFAQVLGAAEEPEESEGIDLLLPESSELIAGIIAFAIIFFFVWKWALPALDKSLAARQQAITGQLTEAEQTKADAESLLQDYRNQIAGARSEAESIVDDARQNAEAMKADIMSKAEAEAAETGRRARADAAAEKERAAGQIRDEVASLSLELAQRVVSGTIDEQAQRALVDRYIDELGEMDG